MDLRRASRDVGQTRPVSTTDDLRELVLGAGVELLSRDGLMLTSDSISYAKVFAYLEEEHDVRVTRGSVHERIWSSHGEFRWDVFSHAIDRVSNSRSLGRALYDTRIRLEHVRRAAGEQVSPFDASEVGQMIWAQFEAAPRFHAVQSLKAIASRLDEPVTAEVLRGRLSDYSERWLEPGGLMLGETLRQLHRRCRGDLGLRSDEVPRVILLLMDSLFVGAHVRQRAGCSGLSEPVPSYRSSPAPGAATATVASVATNALFDLLTEKVSPKQLPETDQQFSAAPAATLADLELRQDLTANRRENEIPDGQRRSRVELKRLVLNAGVELLFRDGLALQTEALKYSSVLSYIKQRHEVVVNRASIHGRIWLSHDDFCLDVLARHLTDSTKGAESPARLLSGNSIALSRLSGQRSPSIREGIRTLMIRQVNTFAASPYYRRRLLVMAALVDKPESPSMDRLCKVIQQTDRDLALHYEQFVSERVVARGCRVRPELGLSQAEAVQLLVQISQAMVTGSVYNHLGGLEDGTRLFSIRFPESDEPSEWNLAGLALLACFEHLFTE